MAAAVETASSAESIRGVASPLREEELCDLVIEEDGKPVGLVTDPSVAMAVANGNDLDAGTATDIMTAAPITFDEDPTAIDLTVTMAEDRVRRVPVVDEGQLVDIATPDDVVATTGKRPEDVATVVAAQPWGFTPSD